MDAEPLGRFPFQKLAKYPHMKPEDVAVWERFISTVPDAFERCDYDVPCGTGAAPRPEDDENIQYMHVLNSQKKIDVVGYKDGTQYVIEVKPVADARALGQILTYTHLFSVDRGTTQNIVPMIVCGEVEREMEVMFNSHGIVVAKA